MTVGDLADVMACEIAVETGEVAARPGLDRLDAASQRDVDVAQLVRGDRPPRPHVVEQRSQPVFLLGGGELHAGEAGGERRHRRVPVGAEVVDVVGEALGGGVADGLDEEARRHPFGRPPQVAAGEEEHPLADALARAASNRRWSSSTARGAQEERAAGGPPIGIGEERVVAHSRGEESLGEAADEDPVEVEAESQGDVAHEQTVAEPAHPSEVGVELELERAPEHRQPGRRFDRVEPGEPRERGLDLVRRLALRVRPVRPPRLGRQMVTHEALGPGRELTPARLRGDGEVGHQGRHELLQGAGGGDLRLEMLGVGITVGHGPLGGELELPRARRTGRAAAATARPRARPPRLG